MRDGRFKENCEFYCLCVSGSRFVFEEKKRSEFVGSVCGVAVDDLGNIAKVGRVIQNVKEPHARVSSVLSLLFV